VKAGGIGIANSELNSDPPHRHPGNGRFGQELTETMEDDEDQFSTAIE
jgi:hypothetical protein